jgi:thiol:disulfide interchange protein DsbD
MKLKTFMALLAILLTTPVYAASVTQGHLVLTLISFFGVGLMLAFTPCVFPMVPILSAILAGQKNQTVKRAFSLSVIFVLSMALTYSIAGLMVGYLGETVQTLMQQPKIIISFSLLFVVMALAMFGVFDLALPAAFQTRLHHINNRLSGGSYLGVAAMGVLSTLIASPCVTPPLLTILTYISQSKNALQGGLILFVLALGMGVPLILFAIGQSTLLPKAGAWMEQVKKIFGVLMLGLAIWMLSRVVSGVTVMYLWASLIIVSSVAFGALDFRGDRRMPPVMHGVTVLTLLYGVFVLAGAASGREELMNPLSPVISTASASTQSSPSTLFTYVETLPQLKSKIAKAAKQHKPVMIEFFATWCPYCKQVDKDVLSSDEIRKSMKAFVTLRVDISDQNAEVSRIMDEYNIVGVPTNLFNASSLNEGIYRDSLQSVLRQLS